MQKTKFNIDTASKWLQPKCWFAVFILLSVIKTYLAFKVNFTGIMPVLLILHKIVVISGLISAWYGCDKLRQFIMSKKWFAWLSAFAFMIYVLHAPVIVYATKAIFIEINDWAMYRITTFILLPVFLLVISVITGALLRKLLPGVYHFVTGGRGLEK